MLPFVNLVLGAAEHLSARLFLSQSVLILTIRPSMMPKLSLMTLARGARQLVVQEALLWRCKKDESISFNIL